MAPLTRAVQNADNPRSENPANWSLWRDYNYDAGLLNWQSVNDNGYLAPFASNGVNQYTSVNGQGPQYDGNFNLTDLSGLSASYDAENRLVWGSNNGHTLQFTYDGLGRCVRRTVNGSATLFTYDGWNPILEWDQAGNWKATNVYGARPDEILARVDCIHGPLIYKQDRRGSVTFLLDGANQIVEKYTYDAFGTPKITDASGNVRTESAFGNRFMFTGREYIKELGIYDYRHRVYHPGLGRFLQSDPLGFAAGDGNLLRYCGGDPVNLSDPYGLTNQERKKRDSNAYGKYKHSVGARSFDPRLVEHPRRFSNWPRERIIRKGSQPRWRSWRLLYLLCPNSNRWNSRYRSWME